MNRPQNPLPQQRRKRGMALLMVLSCLALLSMLVLALLSMSRTERKAATTFAESVEVRNLAELPVNLVAAQIRKATEQLGVEKTWASQPGMIRVFGTEADGSGYRSKAMALYKLYSDDEMVVTKSNATATTGGLTPSEVGNALRKDTEDLAKWDQQAGVFTDLNDPIPVLRDGVNPGWEFPIVDPRAATAGDSLAVEGFSYENNGVPGAVQPQSREDMKARLPMPVRWLYVLQDGSLAAPASSDNGTVRFGGAVKPTRENPIVGRIAYWTDDDSTKVNVNTATEGTAWSVPRANTPTERDAAAKMPVRNEFSRYPGHPSMTSLSPVFQAFGPEFVVSPWMAGGTRAQVLERYHELSPRIVWGGTQGGTVASRTAITDTKDDRLYATLDELIFDRDRTLNSAQLDHRDLAIGKFFLTPHSRAPELNLFNKPRIGLWPVSKSATERNAQDKLLAFLNSAGVEGGSARSDGWSFYRAANADIAAGRSGSSQSPSDDLSTSIRNDALMNSYLAFLTGQKNGSKQYLVPGFGNRTMLEKYGREKRDQILTEVFDLIRWGVASENVTGTPEYRFLPAHNDKETNPSRRGESSATPIITHKGGEFTGFNTNVSNAVVKNTKGFGRFPTITEATLVFIATAHSGKDKNGDGKPDTTKMRAFLVVEPFSPTCGSPAWTATWRYRVLFHDPVNSWKTQMVGSADIKPMQFPPSASAGADDPEANYSDIKKNWPTSMVNAPIDLFEGGNMTPFSGLLTQFKKAYMTSIPAAPIPGKTGIKPMNNLASGDPNAALGFPFYSELIDVKDKNMFEFTGGELAIALFTGWTGTDLPVQKIRMRFPNTQLKVPTLSWGDHSAGFTTLSTRFSKPALSLRDGLIRPGDITRSVEASPEGPAKGDLRHFAALAEVPETYFVPSPNYHNTNVEQVHGLRDGAWTDEPQMGQVKTTDTAGTLVAGVTYPAHSPPAVPRGLQGAINAKGRPGDWDTGVGLIEDGPYINKPDEANVLLQDGGYFQRGGEHAEEDGTSFAPNRQISSAAAFGSLPTGIHPTKPEEAEPWQTLLFCPNPASRSTSALDEPTGMDHKGFEAPRDHLLLDLFWMPVVEPFAISEAFSTAGKINMNYQIMPFTYVERSTGIHAALKSVTLGAIPPDAVGGYKNPDAPYARELRYHVDAEKTLDGFEKRFSRSDVFRSASEICEIFLVPQRKPNGNYGGPTPGSYDSMTEWWNGSLSAADANDLTGDNLREEPYGVLYPRLTTKSNTFTVHYRVQGLQKVRGSDPETWVEDRDRVASDYRGSMTLERYMDPNELEIGEVGVGSGEFANTWDTHYRIRVIQRKQFTP